MKRLLSYIFNGHVHKWVVLDRKDLKVVSGTTNTVKGYITTYTLQCEKCGCIKAKEVKTLIPNEI